MGYETAGEQAVPYEDFLDTYGLGPEDLDKVVTFGGHTGPIWKMLADERCPVGTVVADAYAQDGPAGVEAKFVGLSMVSRDFEFQISDTTRAFHEGTTDRATLLESSYKEGNRDFLV